MATSPAPTSVSHSSRLSFASRLCCGSRWSSSAAARSANSSVRLDFFERLGATQTFLAESLRVVAGARPLP